MVKKCLSTVALSLSSSLLALAAPPVADVHDKGAQKAQSAAASLAPDTVAVVVDGKSIKIADIDKELQRPEMAAFYQSVSKDPQMLNQLRAGILNSFVNKELLLNAAKESKVISDADVKKSVDQFVLQQGGKDKIEPVLKQRGMTWDQFEKELVEGMRIQTFIEKDLTKDIKVADADIKKMFDAEPERYGTPERVKARHILLMTQPGAKPEEKAAVKKKADDLYAQATKPDADFGALASANSEDPGSKAKGGDLGFFSRGMMVPEFEKAAFETAPGQITKPVESQFGFHIIKVEEKSPAQKAEFPAVKDRISEEMVMKERSKVVQEKLDAMRKSARVQFKIPELAAAPSGPPMS